MQAIILSILSIHVQIFVLFEIFVVKTLRNATESSSRPKPIDTPASFRHDAPTGARIKTKSTATRYISLQKSLARKRAELIILMPVNNKIHIIARNN